MVGAALTYHWTATAPGRETVTLTTEIEHPCEQGSCRHVAREQAADFLGVRAEHVALRLDKTEPQF